MDLVNSIGDCKHLRVYNRAEKFIIFNPTIPSWVFSNATGAVILKIASAGYPLGQVMKIAADNGISRTSVEQFFEKCFSAKLFEVGEKGGRWKDGGRATGRRLQSINLHLTNQCNLSCSYCYRNSSPRIQIKRFGHEFNAFLDDCRDIRTENPAITFTGGEPMTHPDFWEVAEYAKSIGFSNHLLTNGTFVTPFNALKLAGLFESVKISLDGASEATHAKTRGADNFEAVINGINVLSQYFEKGRLMVQTTVNSDNLEEVTLINDILPKQVEVRHTPLMRMGRGLQTDPIDIINNDQFHNLSRKLDDGNDGGSRMPQMGKRTFGCHAGDSHISVADNGDVYPCHLFHQNAFKMGNIFVDKIAHIFRLEKMSEFGASMDVENNNSQCSSCDIRYLCGGGCKANPLHASKDYRKPDIFCSFYRKARLDDLFSGWQLN
jgi:radical SAM protein with 4Fe4S-binding SPASM domain